MKKLLVLIICMSLSAIAFAQNMQEVIYLKNGSVIRGTIVEQIPGQSVKIETADGNVFVYQMDEVVKITKEESKKKTSAAYDFEHPGLDFLVELGPDFAKGSNTFSANIGLGRRFSKGFYLGGLAGASFGKGNPTYNIALNPKVYIPINNTRFSLSLDFRAGMRLHPDMKEENEWGESESKGRFASLGLIPTFNYALVNTVDVSLGAGYIYDFNIAGVKNVNGGAFVIRAGFNFHKANYDDNNKRKEKVKKVKPGIRDNGLQLTYELDYVSFKTNTFSLIPTYKINPNLSVGLGAGVGYSRLATGGFDTDEGYYDNNHDEDGYSYNSKDIFSKFFLRGNYRFNDNKFSPFVNLDAGLMTILCDRENNEGSYDEGYQVNSMYAEPSIGLSWRTSNNTYFNIMAGFHLGSGAEDLTMAGFRFGVNYTHTFKWFSSNPKGRQSAVENY